MYIPIRASSCGFARRNSAFNKPYRQDMYLAAYMLLMTTTANATGPIVAKIISMIPKKADRET